MEMSNEYNQQIEALLSNPERLLLTKPFTRGVVPESVPERDEVAVGQRLRAHLPQFDRIVVTQDQFLAELDPHSHEVLRDENIPSIAVKLNDGFQEIKYKKLALPIQKVIVNKQFLHQCGNRTTFTIDDENPAEQKKQDFARFKRLWKRRNIDGAFSKMVLAQKSEGAGALLFYYDLNGKTKCRLLKYSDGYVVCSHNDRNGDRIMECVYYFQDGFEHIDCYDMRNHCSFVRGTAPGGRDGWVMEKAPSPHGFNEIPIVSKRGAVAWNDVQGAIEFFEIMYNIFLVIQKRHGWGLLYIKGNFDQNAKKIAGSIILNDRSLDGSGNAEYLTPPSPQGMIDTMKGLFEQIQVGSGTTIILPKDISLSGDVSGVAVQIAQSLDNETAGRAAIDWQNVIDKMARLFSYGIAVEAVREGKDANAITRWADLSISAEKKPWRPRSDSEYNSMLIQMSQGDSPILSRKTAIEKNTESAPDEELRMQLQMKEDAAVEQ